MGCKLLNVRWAIGIAVLLVLLGCGHGTEPQGTKQPDGVARAVAPESSLQIPTLEGSTVTVDQYRGKVVLVNFWATWCAPCRTEIPWLIEFNQKYGPKGLVILGVAMDDEGNKVVQPYVQSQRFDVNGHPEAMSYPDPARQYQNRRQIWRHSGYADKHALFTRRKENQDDRRLDRPRRPFQNP